MPVIQILAWETTVGGLVLGIISWRRGALTCHTARLVLAGPWFWVRAGVGLVGSVLWVYSLQKMALFQTVALGFASPLLTVIGARLFLDERCTPRTMTAIVCATSGGLLLTAEPLIRTWGTSIPWWTIAWQPIASTLCFNLVTLMDRKLLLQHSALVTTPLFFLIMAAGLITQCGGWILPAPQCWVPLGCLCLVNTTAHLALGQALSCAPVTFLMPFGVLKVLLSTLVGLVIFGEHPGRWSSAGFGLIATSFVLLTRRLP